MSNLSLIEQMELDQQWTPLMIKIARWGVAGLEIEDIMQELRVSLFAAHEAWREDGGSKFQTYLYRSLRNKLMLLRRTAAATVRIPIGLIDRVCDGHHLDDADSRHNCGPGCGSFHWDVSVGMDTSEFDLIEGLSSTAKAVAMLAMRGEPRTTWRTVWGLSTEKIKSGIAELQSVFSAKEVR